MDCAGVVAAAAPAGGQDAWAGVIRASSRWRIKSDQASGRVAGRASHREGTFIMPVAFVFESDKVDQSSYDALLKAIGRESLDAPVPPGHIAHLAGPRPGGGWRAIDLWESEEAPAPSTARTSSGR